MADTRVCAYVVVALLNHRPVSLGAFAFGPTPGPDPGNNNGEGPVKPRSATESLCGRWRSSGAAVPFHEKDFQRPVSFASSQSH